MVPPTSHAPCGKLLKRHYPHSLTDHTFAPLLIYLSPKLYALPRGLWEILSLDALMPSPLLRSHFP